MRDDDKLDLAKKAVFHVLDAIECDPRKYWLMGEGTGCFDTLTAAAAAFWGENQDNVKKRFQPDKDKYAQYLRELEENRKLLDAKLETVACAAIVPEPVERLRCPACGGDVAPPPSQSSNTICAECFCRLKLIEAA